MTATDHCETDSGASLRDIKSSLAADIQGILDDLSQKYFVHELLDMRTLEKDVRFVNRLLDEVRVSHVNSHAHAAVVSAACD
jgi:hypothetical protein